MVWNIDVPPKVQFLLWRGLLDRLPCRINLARRNVVLQASCCVFCLKHMETMDHVFVQCEEMRQIWNNCFRWFNYSNVFTNLLVDNFNQYPICLLYKTEISKWRIVWTAVIWCTWNMRNNIIFSNWIFDRTKLRLINMNSVICNS